MYNVFVNLKYGCVQLATESHPKTWYEYKFGQEEEQHKQTIECQLVLQNGQRGQRNTS